MQRSNVVDEPSRAAGPENLAPISDLFFEASRCKSQRIYQKVGYIDCGIVRWPADNEVSLLLEKLSIESPESTFKAKTTVPNK